MNRDDIIRMVKEAGFMKYFIDPEPPDWITDNCERFAALVAAAEREACARVCEGQGVGQRALEHYAALTYSGSAHDCAAAIRARNEK